MTPAELERIKDARSQSRIDGFKLGRVTLRLLLANVLEQDPAAIDVSIRPDGSLFLPEHKGYISLSHTADAAAAVIGKRPVGIDIEEIKERRPDLYTYVLHPDEYHLIEESGLDTNQATILFWTLKEAVLKGRRSGLRHSPRKIRLTLDFSEQTGKALSEDGDAWQLAFTFENGMYRSIAYADNRPSGALDSENLP